MYSYEYNHKIFADVSVKLLVTDVLTDVVIGASAMTNVLTNTLSGGMVGVGVEMVNGVEFIMITLMFPMLVAYPVVDVLSDAVVDVFADALTDGIIDLVSGIDIDMLADPKVNVSEAAMTVLELDILAP